MSQIFNYKDFIMNAIWVESTPDIIYGNIAPNKLLEVNEKKGDSYYDEADIIGVSFKHIEQEFHFFINMKLKLEKLKKE